MAFFIEINGLAKLENHQKWEKARTMLYELWNANRENLDLLLRLLSECWCVLYHWTDINNKNLSYQAFKDTLVECITYGLTHFSKDFRFLWMGGYMISLSPDLFYDGDTDVLYPEWKSKGNEMLALLYRQNPNNLMAEVLYLGLHPVSVEYNKYKEAKKRLIPLLDEYFTEDTGIERYFRSVLTPYPEIRIHFNISSVPHLDVITNLLGVQPTRSRETEFILEPFYFWSIDTKQSQCRCLEDKFGEMISILEPKIETLKQLVKSYDLKLSFTAIILMEDGDAPELSFSKETIALLASLNAQFGVTINRP